MGSHTYQTQAIVIKDNKIGETDKLVTLYTPEFGKLKAVARGAYRPGSKLGGNVEPFTYSLVMLARGRSLDIITQSQTIDAFPVLKSNLWRMACGLYILELIDSFTVENDENRPLFNSLLNSLCWLSQDKSSEIVLYYFELHLLHHLGYRPQLTRCVSCGATLKPEANFFSYSQGGILCLHCRQQDLTSHLLSVNALKVLRLWQSHNYATAKQVKLSPELSSELEQVLQGYIRYLLQREVNSLAWLEELRRKSLVDSG
jgi:DNA repair protein RecO (recombination protein O)